MSKQAIPNPAKQGVDALVCFAIYSAGHAFNRFYKPLLRAIGLTYPQYLVMVALWSDDDLTVGALGDRLMLESNTLTPLLKRLEGMGLLSRRRDEVDERQVRVTLTARGRGLKAKAREIPRCAFEATGLSLETLLRLQADITALRENLHQAARER